MQYNVAETRQQKRDSDCEKRGKIHLGFYFPVPPLYGQSLLEASTLANLTLSHNREKEERGTNKNVAAKGTSFLFLSTVSRNQNRRDDKLPIRDNLWEKGTDIVRKKTKL